MNSSFITKLNAVASALKNNNFDSYVAKSKAEAVDIVKSLINKGDKVATGGSVTLHETGVIDLLKNGDYDFIQNNFDMTKQEEKQKYYRECFSVDTYLCSSNAIISSGQLYNVDGNANRVAAIAYGPTQVIIVAGYNKIVDTLDEAIFRVKTLAAPNNTKRLSIDTYCSKENKCVSLNNPDSVMCDGCNSDSRICCDYLVSGRQRHKDRIKVILVAERLGY